MRERSVDRVNTLCIRIETLNRCALHHRSIVVIRHHVALWVQLVGVAYHFKQTHRLGLSIDDEVGVENFMAAMLRVRLRKHHQFDIGRIALQFDIRIAQIIDFVLRQSQTQLNIGFNQSIATLSEQGNGLQGLARQILEQRMTIVFTDKPRFGHTVVHVRRDLRQRII